jgi:lipopolysaccharide export system protein LptA
MVKPKKKRKGDANQVAYSVVQDVIRLSGKPFKAPPKPRKRR